MELLRCVSLDASQEMEGVKKMARALKTPFGIHGKSRQDRRAQHRTPDTSLVLFSMA